MIAIYLRCSSAKQDNASQAVAIRDHLNDRGLLSPDVEQALAKASESTRTYKFTTPTTDIFVDWARTGKPVALFRRKGWSEFFRNHGDYSELVVFSMDRIIRDMEKQQQLLGVLGFHGCKVTAVTMPETGEQIVDTMRRVLESWRGEQEIQASSRRIRQGLKATRERNARLYRDHLAGDSDRTLADRYNLRREQVQKIIRAKGEHTHTMPDPAKAERDREMFELWTSGEHTAREIMDRFGVSSGTFRRAVLRWKRELGLPMGQRVGGVSVEGPLRDAHIAMLRERARQMRDDHIHGA